MNTPNNKRSLSTEECLKNTLIALLKDKELVDIIAEENGISKLSAEEVQELFVESEDGVVDPFAALKRRKQKNYKQKLRAGTPLLRAR